MSSNELDDKKPTWGIMIPLGPSKPLKEPIFSFDVSKLDVNKIELDGITIFTNRTKLPTNEQ